MINMLDLGWGITQLDTAFQRPNMAACYIMQDGADVAIIETGTKDTVPLIFECLQQLGLKPEQVKYIIPTHVHLDHAGGVGLLMQQLPSATLVVHEKGARHMIDPSKLQAGATAVYGEAEFSKTYGDLLPVAKERVISPKDNEQLTLGQRTLTFLDSPGHARHHFCVFDEVSKGFFSGDTFGLAYQELTNENGAFLFVTTTPVQFDPEALKNSINKLMAVNPQRMFLTHYGMLENPQSFASDLTNQVDTLVQMAQQLANDIPASDPAYTVKLTDNLLQFFLQKLKAHGSQLTLDQQTTVIKTDVLLNAQGLSVWMNQQAG